jgi:uncharacterized protein
VLILRQTMTEGNPWPDASGCRAPASGVQESIGVGTGRTVRIGVIADTHGVVHPRLDEALAGVDHIVHAGDIGGAHVLRALERIAPVTYVEGNNDDASGEDVVRVTVAGIRILLTHILPRPARPGPHVTAALQEERPDVVIFGHSHLPHDELIDGIRYFNPASAGPRRFDYPVSIGLLEKNDHALSALHVALDDRSVEALRRRMNQLRG